MKIAFVTNELPPSPTGGLGVFVHRIVPLMQARGHKVWVIGCFGRDYGWDQSVYNVLDMTRTSGQRRLMRLKRKLAGLAPAHVKERWREARMNAIRDQIVHLRRTQGLELVEWPSNRGPFLAPVPGVCDVLRLHGLHKSCAAVGLDEPVTAFAHEARTLAGVDNWIGITQFILDDAQKLFGLGPRRSAVIYYPIDLNQFRSASQHGPSDWLDVIFVGTLCERKGSLRLGQAANQFLRACGRARLIYIGRDPQQERAKIQQAVDEDLRDRVIFRQQISSQELAQVMRSAAVMAVPSRHEAAGLVYIEAMACGLAIVGGNGTGIPEIVPHGQAGLLVDPMNVQAIGAAVSELLQNDALRQSMGTTGRQRAEQMFEASICAVKTEQFYEQALNESRD